MRLWVRLSLAFAVIVLVGSLTAVSISVLLNRIQAESLPELPPLPAPGLPPTRILLDRAREVVILIGIVGGVFGLIFGILVSRSLTAPLQKLAEAARAIQKRNLQARVTPERRGSREIRELAETFNEMAAALEESERLRRNLIADVAHELRTPLSVVQGGLLAIIDGVYPLDTAEISRLYDQTHLLSSLVNDLHDLSLADARQLRLHLLPTDLNDLLLRVVSAFAPTAEEAGVTMRFRPAPDLPLIRLDAMRITQVFNNLVGNALRHTPSGGEISIQAYCEPSAAVINISDTGEGISAEHLPHVFERFYRADKGRARSVGGAGLGLAIVKALVEAHGGTVSAASAGIGQGAHFTVRLPIKQG
ncbi:MAG: hypothetical protein OHK0023_04750 [Anaerolineae bacterium]